MSDESPAATSGAATSGAAASGGTELQFDRAEMGETPAEAPRCDVCGQDLYGHYYEVNGKMTCERCRYDVEAAFQRRGGSGAFFKAGLAGLGMAVAGSLLYYGVREATGYEFGLIAILVGYAVGRAVHWGSRGKGGWVYQSLAIFLTYMAIVSTYLPAIFGEIWKEAEKERAAVTAPAPAASKPAASKPAAGKTQPGAAGATATVAAAPDGDKTPKEDEELGLGGALVGLLGLLLLTMAIPFLMGFENVLGILIILFGLYEAWKLNRRTTLSVAGPFRIGAAPAASP